MQGPSLGTEEAPAAMQTGDCLGGQAALQGRSRGAELAEDEPAVRP